MNAIVRLFPVICACVVTHAFATDPPSNPEPVKPESSASTAAPQSKPARFVLEDKTLTNDEVRQLFGQGYKPVGRNGEVLYCRNEAQTGSRFTTMTCKTANQIKQIMQDSKDMLAAHQKSSGCRASGPC